MIDENGYRLNVGIIIVNRERKLLWAQRSGLHHAWQFPQGGIHEKETTLEAMFRELNEELGLSPEDVDIIAESKGWLSYELPVQYRRYDSEPKCIGQKQKWFLLLLKVEDNLVRLDHSDHPEFSSWRWVDYWIPPTEVITFKKAVYREVLTEFEEYVKAIIPLRTGQKNI